MPKKKQRSRKSQKASGGRRPAATREKAVLIYHDMAVYENFERCARRLFEVLRNAESRMPGKPRHLFLRVQGHRNDVGGFDRDAMEIIRNFAMEFLLPYLTELTTPFHTLGNNHPQRNDVPDELHISYPEAPEDCTDSTDGPGPGFWYDVNLLPLRPRGVTENDRKTAPKLAAIADYLGMDPACLVCWATPVDRAHAVPSSLGGSMDVRNFALLCSDHHRQAPDIADAEAFWAWVDYAEIRDSGSKWDGAAPEVKEWVRAHGGRTEPKDRGETAFMAAVRFELQHLYGWADADFENMSWDLLQEYHQVLEAATGRHFGVEKKVATHAWAYHIARRRLAKRKGETGPLPPDHPWTGTWPVP
ncbi:HNH endonuclease signature motif containing protein [Streptomyces sp. NPDC004732]|uniref:HNH endonuclease signature motif containing protein n=1 Tax=Streptomyces sp. NPDC004732 TaxID=3154290 RepID=UPI0033AB189C